MSVKMVIPAYLQSHTDGLEIFEVDCGTVGKCLGHLINKFPGLEKMLFAADGKLHSYVTVYVNGEDTYPEELAKPVEDGDELYILYIISGG